MRLHWLVGLTLLFNAAGISTALVPEVSNPTVPHVRSRHDISMTRFLRANIGFFSSEEEERGLPSLPVAEKVKNFFSSTDVTPDKLRKWLNNGDSVDTVFARMRLDKAGQFVIHRPQFANWLKYVDDLSAKSASKASSAISRLTAYYGDAALYKMIDDAMKISSTKTLATRLQKEQLSLWLAAAKNPDDVFQFMKLGNVQKNFLSSPEFTTWTKYVDDFSAKFPNKPVSMAPTLLKSYDDATLFKAIIATQGVAGTKSLATKLEDQVSQVWLRTRKSPDDVLEGLEFGKKWSGYRDNTLEKIMDKPFFEGWAKYANAYGAKYPRDKASAIETLTQTFGNAEVAYTLATAKTKEATHGIATKLSSAQMEIWLKGGNSVDDVYKLLKLEPAHIVHDFNYEPRLDAWVSYMDAFVTASPSKADDALFLRLGARFKDKPLAQTLEAAKKYPSLEAAATKLQTEKIEGYLANNGSPRVVFTLLALDDVGGNLFSEALFTKYMKYVEDFNKKNPRSRESWATPIIRRFHVERLIEAARQNPSTARIANLMEREQHKYWLKRKTPPRNVFRDLGLKETGEKTLATPDFKRWVQYLNAFNRRYPEEKTAMIDGLRSGYNDLNLVRMFDAAKKNPDTQKLAADMQGALINKWVADKKPLEALKRRFSHMRIADHMLERYSEKLNALAR